MKKVFLLLSWLGSLSATAQYTSLLWKISGPLLKQPSYLYGTMHTADSRVLQKSERALPYLKQCKAYAMELDPDEAFDMGMIMQLMMGNGYSLKEMLPEKEYALMDSLVLVQTGFPAILLDNAAPIVMMTLLESMAMGLSDTNSKNLPALDLYFHQKAKQQRKKTIGIETISEQLAALNTMTYEEQTELLIETLHQIEQNTGSGEDVLGYYLNEQLDSLLLMNDKDSLPEKFYRALITDRNQRMAERIEKLIAEQPLFVAVGALHLPASNGVIALLRKRGFTVEPVK